MKNSPLIEIIAEVRWGPGDPRQPAQIVFGGDESVYVKFGIEVGKDGYHQLERTMPEGFSAPGGAVAYRYRKSEGEQNTLYQLGTGVFTANGLPPYNSWEEFRPVIERGVQAWWNINIVRPGETLWLLLRYVDVFKQQHLGPMSIADFFRVVVGLNYEKPAAYMAFPQGDASESFRFFGSRRDAEGQELAIDVGQGVQDGEDIVVMNTIAYSKPFEAESVEGILRGLDQLQDASHALFFEMIRRDEGLAERLEG